MIGSGGPCRCRVKRVSRRGQECLFLDVMVSSDMCTARARFGTLVIERLPNDQAIRNRLCNRLLTIRGA